MRLALMDTTPDVNWCHLQTHKDVTHKPRSITVACMKDSCWGLWLRSKRSGSCYANQHGDFIDSINNQGWFWGSSGFDHGLYYMGLLEVNWLTAGEIPCRTKESKRGSVFVILQGWWDKLAQGELLRQMLLHNICHICPNTCVWQKYFPSFALGKIGFTKLL